MAQATVPSLPAAKPVSGKASETFNALKRALNEIASWEMSPNSWDKIQIIYSVKGNDKQAKSFIAAIQLPNSSM